MRRPTILLFDIDGTLVTTGGAGRRAMERAFETLTGRRDAASFPFAGMTDRAIARSGLQRAGHADDEAAIDRLLSLYIALLPEEVESAVGYDVYPGIVHAIDCALSTARTAVGLGTGNVLAGARIKLGRVGLGDRFSFGGFGSDHEDRAELLRIGAKRGASLLSESVTNCRVVVIGDTARDVQAALRIGAECIGVGTGGRSPSELVAHGATRAFESLAEPGALEELLG